MDAFSYPYFFHRERREHGSPSLREGAGGRAVGMGRVSGARSGMRSAFPQNTVTNSYRTS